MSIRIHLHRLRRSNLWAPFEEPLAIVPALSKLTKEGPILLDCLTIWLSNIMLAGINYEISVGELLLELRNITYPVVIVSSEVGSSIISNNSFSRMFCDCIGELNQKVAYVANTVISVTAGLPLVLKSP